MSSFSFLQDVGLYGAAFLDGPEKDAAPSSPPVSPPLPPAAPTARPTRAVVECGNLERLTSRLSVAERRLQVMEDKILTALQDNAAPPGVSWQAAIAVLAAVVAVAAVRRRPPTTPLLYQSPAAMGGNPYLFAGQAPGVPFLAA